MQTSTPPERKPFLLERIIETSARDACDGTRRLLTNASAAAADHPLSRSAIACSADLAVYDRICAGMLEVSE